jgi:hypothetical protein
LEDELDGKTLPADHRLPGQDLGGDDHALQGRHPLRVPCRWLIGSLPFRAAATGLVVAGHATGTTKPVQGQRLFAGRSIGVRGGARDQVRSTVPGALWSWRLLFYENSIGENSIGGKKRREEGLGKQPKLHFVFPLLYQPEPALTRLGCGQCFIAFGGNRAQRTCCGLCALIHVLRVRHQSQAYR